MEMNKLFIMILNMSFNGAFVIAVLCFVRLALRKVPKIISYCLWAAAGFRLLFPFSVESALSLIPFKAQPIPLDITLQQVPRIDSGIQFLNNSVSAALPAAMPGDSANPLQIWAAVGEFIWILGAAVMVIYGVASYVLLKRKMSGAIPMGENIFEAENIQSPFLLGILTPKIYLPAGLSESERDYVLLHERTHINRRDYLVKLFAYFILCLHWFNPFVWLAFILMGADMEMSCDERVLKEMGGGVKKEYSLSLLSLAAPYRGVGGSPLAFGEGGVKARIKNILNFRKPSRVITVIAAVLALLTAAGFMMNKAESKPDDYVIPEITVTETVDGAQAKALRFGYSWYDGKMGVTADSIAPWNGDYEAENTLVIDGAGQNILSLSAENPAEASYRIYLPDGTVYDGGEREMYDSLGPRLFWTEDGSGIYVHAPFEKGEYIYEIILSWEKDNLEVIYGFKVVMTMQTVSYDEALSMVFERYSDPLAAVSLAGTEILPGSEYAGDCYVFEVKLPEAVERVAVSKEKGIFFTYSEGVWWAFTGGREWDGETRPMTMADVWAIAKKIGTDLTMDDLREFSGTEVGSGLYLMRYEIKDSDYVLGVSSGKPPEIWSAYLSRKSDSDGGEVIDIRYYDVDKYVNYGIKELVRPLPED